MKNEILKNTIPTKDSTFVGLSGIETKRLADAIVKSDDVFYRKDFKIGQIEIYVYGYYFNNYASFISDAHREMRGLTITIDQSTNEYNVYPSIKKFWNINETPDTEYNKIRDQIRGGIYEKLDGSLIHYIKVDGEFIPKSKMSINSDQAELAKELTHEIMPILEYYESQNVHPYFELVGPSNRVVLKYPENSLKLIALRDKDTWDFLEIIDYRLEDTLEDVIKKRLYEMDKEGWVYYYYDRKTMKQDIVKIKTEDYLKKHRAKESINNKKILLQNILEDNIDDVLSVITNEEDRKMIINTQNMVNHFILNSIEEINNTLQTVKKSGISRKEFAIRYKNSYFFPILMKFFGKDYGKDYGDSDIEAKIVEKIQKETNKDFKAMEFLEKIAEKTENSKNFREI